MLVSSFESFLLFFSENTLQRIVPHKVAMPLDIKVGKITSDGLCEFALALSAITVAGIS